MTGPGIGPVLTNYQPNVSDFLPITDKLNWIYYSWEREALFVCGVNLEAFSLGTE